MHLVQVRFPSHGHAARFRHQLLPSDLRRPARTEVIKAGGSGAGTDVEGGIFVSGVKTVEELSAEFTNSVETGRSSVLDPAGSDGGVVGVSQLDFGLLSHVCVPLGAGLVITQRDT